MKNLWISLFLTAAAAGAGGAERDVAVILHAGNESPAVIGLATGQATRMLAAAGVTVAWRTGAWHSGAPQDRESAEAIDAVLTSGRATSFKPGALAYATIAPQSAARIEVFYDRVRGNVRGLAVAPVLAHVLVHEITHILEGVERHSESGVMKAHWDARDFIRMSRTALPFADEDLRLIHAWTARNSSDPPAAAMAAER
jgi:hypothetical protein